MQKKQTILVVASLLVVVLSVSLAYFTAQIIGKEKDVTINSADLKIIFTDSDGSISGTNIEPGKWNVTKTFTIENKSNETYKYNIVIQDLVNTFVTNGYLQYKITSTNGGYNMTEFKDVPKSSVATDTILAYSASIDVGVTQTYTVEFIYKNDESVDQSEDMGKTLSGTLYIEKRIEKPFNGGTLVEAIKYYNPTIKTRTDFSSVFTETNTGTLYKATESIASNTPKDVYYFAGNTTNNWVKFGKTKEGSCTYKGKEVLHENTTNRITKTPESETECTSTNICDLRKKVYVVGLTESECNGEDDTWITEKATWSEATKNIYWKIIRTNHDGSIRLLYVGTSTDTTKGYIGISEFNTKNNDPMYVGYKYGTTGSLENNRLNTNNSTIKTYVDNWYKNNLTAYTKYLSNDAVYCNDRELASGSTYNTGRTQFFYASQRRVITNKTPTYNCTNIKDAFSVNNTSAKLDYPVGLMTTDEIVYAGGSFETMNTPYAWFISNSLGTQVTNRWWWSLSPLTWSGTYSDVYGWNDGNARLNYITVGFQIAGAFAVRPVLSLKSCTLYSTGDGSATNPYTILETESGC